MEGRRDEGKKGKLMEEGMERVREVSVGEGGREGRRGLRCIS